MGSNEKQLSVFISLVLRHKPELAKINLDKNGWADVDKLIVGINGTDRKIDRTLLEHIVETDSKMRYCFSQDRKKIRANQGHSVKVDLELKQRIPPDLLYHGTAPHFLDSIISQGLIGKGRLYVHLSNDIDTAVNVGKRHGNVIVLSIDTLRMVQNGFQFFLSENGVWLTKNVPYQYISKNEFEII